MALNLNKQADDSKSPLVGSEKKGLNLNKPADSQKVNFNLTKEDLSQTGNIDSTPPANEENRKFENKKSPLFYILAVLLLLGLGLLWLLNQNQEKPIDSKNENNVNIQNTDSSANANLQDVQMGVKTEDSSNNSSNESFSNENSVKQTQNIESNEISSQNESINKPNSINNGVNSAPEKVVNSLSGETMKDKARKVIIGNFGNGAERKQALGADYKEIQSIVNEFYRKGGIK